MNQVTLDVKITVREDQVTEIARLFEWMRLCGSVGHSSNISVFIDGDGSFRPQITINDKSSREFLGDASFVYDNVNRIPHDVSVELEFVLG